MTRNEDKDQARLEQARELVRAIKPHALYDELDRRMPVVPGYMCRYDDLKRDFAVEVAYETLTRTQGAPALSRPAALELWNTAVDRLHARLERTPITIEIAIEFAILMMARTGPAAAKTKEGEPE